LTNLAASVPTLRGVPLWSKRNNDSPSSNLQRHEGLPERDEAGDDEDEEMNSRCSLVHHPPRDVAARVTPGDHDPFNRIHFFVFMYESVEVIREIPKKDGNWTGSSTQGSKRNNDSPSSNLQRHEGWVFTWLRDHDPTAPRLLSSASLQSRIRVDDQLHKGADA
jgi:hypothetical protein